MNQLTAIDCGEILDISTVKELHEKLKHAINIGEHLILNAEKVERADTAVLQMFTALFRDLPELGISVSWKNPSESLLNSARLLGLEKNLSL